MEATRRLAAFAAETSLSELPPHVVEATKTYILDNLAAGFAGALTPWASMVARLAEEQVAGGPCSLFARAQTAPPSFAALVNGVAIGGFECDHVYVPGSSHPSAAVFPAALAIGERDHLSGADLLAAVALGYEVICRIGRAATRAVEDERGFHGPGTNAPFGAAVAVGKALGLDGGRMTHALGIAGSHGAGLLEFVKEGAMTKRLHIARGAQTGLESALLAAQGFTGPSTVLEGERGFLRVYSPSPRPDLLLEGLGEEWYLLGILVKAYPCHISFHAVIDAIHRFRQGHPYAPDELEGVRVTGAGLGGEHMLEGRFVNREPTTVLGAQYSLPFAVAVALVKDAADPQTWSEETLWDPRVRALAQRVELASDPERFGGPGKPFAEVALTVGKERHTFIATDWRGAPSNPCTFDDMVAKFRRYAASCISPARADEIIERVQGLEREPDAAALARLIRAT